MAASQDFKLDPTVVDEITSRLLDAIIDRVVEVIRAEVVLAKAPATMAWLDAQEVAQRLGVSREWVYEHADDLGAARIGSGPRPRLRFPPHVLDSRAGGLMSPDAASEPTKRSKPKGLIPIHAS